VGSNAAWVSIDEPRWTTSVLGEIRADAWKGAAGVVRDLPGDVLQCLDSHAVADEVEEVLVAESHGHSLDQRDEEIGLTAEPARHEPVAVASAPPNVRDRGPLVSAFGYQRRGSLEQPVGGQVGAVALGPGPRAVGGGPAGRRRRHGRPSA